MNATEKPESPESPESPENHEDPDSLAGMEPPAAADGTQSSAESGDTSLYVRRGRTPTLAFWVALALAVPAVAALISAPFFEFADLGGVFTFVLLAVVFVGLPLAALAAVIDSLRHRTPRRRGR